MTRPMLRDFRLIDTLGHDFWETEIVAFSF